MNTNIKLGSGTLFFQDDNGEYKEIGSIGSFNIEPEELKEASKELIEEPLKAAYKESFINGQAEFILKPTYKKWFRKKKGNRYVLCYEIRKGFDPRIFGWLLEGEIDENRSNKKGE